MNRWVWFTFCATLGLVLLVCAFVVPAPLRAVDGSVLEKAGRNTPALVAQGLALVRENKLGTAQVLARAAQAERVPGRESLNRAVADLAAQHPGWAVWGGPEPELEKVLGSGAGEAPGKDAAAETPSASPRVGGVRPAVEPFMTFIIRAANRQKALEFLAASPQPAVQELLRCRGLTNTAIFPPAESAAGQAFEATLAIGGLLLEQGRLTAGLSNQVFTFAWEANHAGNPQRLEQVLLAWLRLGQRFNWGQLGAFVSRIEDAETLRLQGILASQVGGELPVVFAAVQLTGQPAAIARYLMNFSQTGLRDLGAGLRFGAGGLNELLQRNQRLEAAGLAQRLAGTAPWGAVRSLAAGFCWRAPWFGLTVKWILYLAAGFFLAAALHFTRRAVSALEKPLQVRGFHVAREILFALGFLLVVLLLSEPFLAQESQRVEFTIRLRPPTVGGVVPAGPSNGKSSIMNQMSLSTLLPLLLFFVLQGLIYTACLVKLAEIRRQRVPARMKLKLLENEDHLFDAGLYLGFVGTIISLIMVSLGVIKFSLMAAYSSTSFGIIFVSIFKIFHLRPVRRRMLLEAEASAPERIGMVSAPVFTSPT